MLSCYYSKLSPQRTAKKVYTKSDRVQVLKSIFWPIFFQLDFPVYFVTRGSKFQLDLIFTFLCDFHTIVNNFHDQYSLFCEFTFLAIFFVRCWEECAFKTFCKKCGFRRYLQILGSLRSWPHFFWPFLGGGVYCRKIVVKMNKHRKFCRKQVV